MARHLKCKVIVFDPVGSKPLQSKLFKKIKITKGYDKNVHKFLSGPDQKILVNISSLSANDMVDWFEEFFSHDWSNMIIIVDEVHFIAPQMGGKQSHNFLRFVKTCRNYNTGLIITSQRPQSVSKEVLALCDMYIIGRIVYPLDRRICVNLIEPFYSKEELAEKERHFQEMKYMEFLVVNYGTN